MIHKHFSAERSTYIDRDTGATVIQWTDALCTNQHLYFTSPSVTGNDRWLILISDRDGSPNLYAIDRLDGEIRRLSNNENGLLRSYVYPQGGLKGFSKVSPCLDSDRNRIFYIQDDNVFFVDLDGRDAFAQKICDLPAGWYGAYTHISPDGKTLCIPCTDPRAFADEKTQWEQLRRVPVRMEKGKLVTRIYMIDVTTGARRVAAEVPFWVTHVQFDPAETGRLLFNLEGHAIDSGVPLLDRIWCLEIDGSFRPLSPQLSGEWRSHENWALDGKSIIYHGVCNDRSFIAARTWEGELLYQTELDGISFWHATGALDGRRSFVDQSNGFVSILDPGAKENRLVNLCRHDTSMEHQDAHAHPLTTPNGRSVVFTSNRSGHCQVYEVVISSLGVLFPRQNLPSG